MSESNDAPPPSNPPDDAPAGSPFPESSLTPPPLPPQEPAPEPPAFGVPTPAPPPPASPSWMAPAAPPAPSGGLVSGDPLGGHAPAGGDPLAGASPSPTPAPAPNAFPAGYTSPPPPGASGGFTPPPAPTFGSGGHAPGTFVLAGWWRRVGAAVIDGIIISTIAFVIMAPLGIGMFATGDGDTSDGGFIALVLGFFVAALVIAVVALAYAPVMMGKTNGKTLGRMATGIRVVRADGQAMTIGFAALREVAVKALLIGAVAGSFTFGLASLLDVLWPLWDDENRALHDFVVNTRTVMG